MPSKKVKHTVSSSIFDELAARNVRKSAKNYNIYFFTLMLSVCLFYSFNSVSTQFASLGLEDRLSYLAFSSSILTAFSLIVCCIMGALVVYANRFLLKRRKKEMGIYATLGMERSMLNKLLMKETLRIGVMSLAAGLVMGVFAAQVLSLITAKLAGLSLESYRFMISFKAIILSVVFFGVLFFFVHLFNVRELKKMSLLDMLYAERKNETNQEGKYLRKFMTAVLAAALILGGYAYIYIRADQDLASALGVGGVMLIAGTIFFFSSALSVMVMMMKKNQFSYFKGINIFTASQFASRIKSEGRSGAMISILLFLSLSLTILGPGLGKYVMNGIENATPYDGMIYYALGESETFYSNPMEALRNTGFEIEDVSESYESSWIYQTPAVTSSFLTGDKEEAPDRKQNMEDETMDYPLAMIGVDDYNRLMSLQGVEPVELGNDNFAVAYAFPPIEEAVKAFAKNPQALLLGERSLSLKENGIYHRALENKNVLVDQGTIIVPQELTEDLTPRNWVLNFNFSGDTKTGNELLYDKWYKANSDSFHLMSAEEVTVSITADNLLMTYLGLYLGITFLITSGAVLALQQLTHSSDNEERYRLLRKLGVSSKDMKRSLSKQLRVHFGMPMFVAIINSAVVIALVFRYFEGFPIRAMAIIIGAGALLVGIVYLVYFITTYLGSRRILKF